MSKSKYITVKGKAYWPRLFEENKDNKGFEDSLVGTGGQYVVNVDLDEDSLAALTSSKSQSVNYPKEMLDNDGNEITTYRFKRMHEKYDRSGKLLEWASGAPKITDEDGNHWDVENQGFIGNGSEVEIRLCVYEAGRVVGTRIESVKVLDLVRYEEKEVA